MGKEPSSLFTLKSIAIPSHKSFPTCGKDLNFLPLYMAILDHIGNRSPEMQNYPSPHGEGVMLPSWKCILPQLLPKIQHYPSPQILSHLYVEKDSSPFKMHNSYKYFLTKYFLFIFQVIFIYLHFFLFYYFLQIFFPPPFFFFFLFLPKLGILPQSEKIIPQHLRRIVGE